MAFAEPQEKLPRLGPLQRKNVLRHVLSFQPLYDRAYTDLKDSYFDQPGDSCLWHIWRAVKYIVKSHFNNKLPSPDILWALIPGQIEASVLAGEVDLSVEDEVDIVADNGILHYLFADNHGLDYRAGEILYAQLLKEKLVYDQIVSMAAQCNDVVPVDIHKQIERIQVNDRFVRSMQSSSARSAAPEEIEDEGIGKETTGLTFLDDMMNGGDAPLEVYGIMGAYGSGKTTIAVQACVQKALYFQSEAAPNKAPRSCHLFFYEASYNEIVRRVWSHAAQIDRSTIERFNGKNWEILSTQGKLAPYEYTRFAKQIGDMGVESVLGEYERFLLAKERINKNVVLHDFSGMSSKNSAQTYGQGYVDEIAASLHRYREETGMEIGAVYIDYVLIACRRYSDFKNFREERLRHLITNFPGECLRQISGPFNCRVYMMHQLTGAANARNFNATFTNADSGESKQFPENLMFNFVLGPRDKETGCIKLHLTKHRRGPDKQPVLLLLDGATGTFSVADDYAVDKATGKPCLQQDMDQIATTMVLPQLMPIDDCTVDLQHHEDPAD